MLKFNKKSGGKFAQQIKEVLYKEILQINFFLKIQALVGLLSQLSVIPCSKRLWVQFLMREHTQYEGSIPGMSTYRRQPIQVSLIHRSFSFSLSLKSIKKTCPWVRIKVKNIQYKSGQRTKAVENSILQSLTICSTFFQMKGKQSYTSSPSF